MTARTIEVSGDDVALSIRHGQIVSHRPGEEPQVIPTEDVGLLILDASTASYSHATIAETLAAGAAIVFCGKDHLPAGMAVPTAGHHIQTQRFRAQMEATAPARKRIWQALVREKIARQAAACQDEAVRTRLLRLAGEVASGDPHNREAVAAKAYWGCFLPGFRRDPEGPHPNGFLNYGYMALRAAIARAIVAAGFHPSLGVQHSNKYNAFCLADDLVEPFRPAVDATVRGLVAAERKALDRETKRALLALLHRPCRTESGDGPFVQTLERYMASFHRCLLSSRETLDIPLPLA